MSRWCNKVGITFEDWKCSAVAVRRKGIQLWCRCSGATRKNVAHAGLKMWRRPGSKCGTDRAQNVAHAGLKMWRRRGLRCSISKKQLLKTLINSRKLADVLTCSHDKVYLYMYLIPNSSVWQQSAASKPQLGNRTDCGITTTGVKECYFDCITR